MLVPSHPRPELDHITIRGFKSIASIEKLALRISFQGETNQYKIVLGATADDQLYP